MQEDWAVWQAIYDDGTIINQKEFKVSYEELDRSKLAGFHMLRDGVPILTVPFSEGQGGRLIWRRRVQMTSNGEQRRIYIVGKRGAFVAALLENGSILVDDKFSDQHPLFLEVEAVKGELSIKDRS